MARRYIGDAKLYLMWTGTSHDGRERYVATVTVKDASGKRLVWTTKDLRTGVGGTGDGLGGKYAVDAPEAHDAVADTVIAFATHTEGDEGSEEQLELEGQGFPPYAVAKAIEEAVQWAMSEREGYQVRRSENGPVVRG